MTYYKEWWARNKDRINAERKEYNSEYCEKNADKKLLNSCRHRAKKAGLPFDLDLSDIVIPEVCPILNKPMIRCTPYAPSVDRIKPSLGYVKGNVQIISKLANVMKNNASDEDLRSFAQWVTKTYPL